MAFYYLDTSALVKLYVREAGTDRMLELASRAAGNQFAVLALAQVEIRSAIRRRERASEIDSTAADQVLVTFQRHLESKFLRQGVSDSMLDRACDLIDKHGLTAFDGVQLAGYLELRVTSGKHQYIFVSADQELLKAAQLEALPIFDPCYIRPTRN